MKTTLLVLVLAVAIALVAPAANAQLNWEVGAKGGVNFANLYGDDVIDNASTTAFAIGMSAMAGVNENFGVMVDALWTRKGAKDDDPTSIFFGETLTLDYIEIPVMAAVMFPATETTRMMFFAGPAVGFNISAEFADADVSDTIASVDFGGVVGLGSTFNTGGANIGLDARWTFGFTSIDDTDFDFDTKNTVFSIMGSVSFPVGQ